MNREELQELIVGPIATVPTPFDADFEVDHGRMAELTKWWVANGLVKGKSVIKVAAAMGEGPMLSDQELPALLRTTVQAADDKAAIMLGLGYKDTKRTIEDAKRAQDLGAIALQVVPPIFNLPTQDDILRFFGDLSDAIDIGIMVYVTKSMYTPIYMDTYRKMVDFEHVVAIKWSVPPGHKNEDIYDLKDVFNIIDNTGHPILNHQMGGTGYINHTVEAHPAHDLKIWDLMESGKYDEAQALYQPHEDQWREFAGKIGKRPGGQAVVKKGMMAIMGWPVGASRPPSLPLTSGELAELYDIMDGWGWPVATREDVLGVAAPVAAD